MLYLDADEFLVINNDKITNVKQLLSHYQYADAVSCNWLLFGSNFHIKEPDGLIIDNYIRSETTLSDTLKTFIRPSQFVTPDPHRPLIKFPNKAYHVNGRQLKNDADNYFYKNRINFEKAQVFIAHYVVQSEETYIRRKLNLPNDDRGEFRNNIITWVVDNSSNIDNLDKLHNDTINTLVKIRYSEKIKNYLENIK